MKTYKEPSFTFVFLSELNSRSKDQILSELYALKKDEITPCLDKETVVNNYNRSDFYLGKEVNKYLGIKFLNCEYEHANLFDRFLLPTFNLLQEYPDFYKLNYLVEGITFYRYELPEIRDYKYNKLVKVTGVKDIDYIADRAKRNIENRHIEMHYDKSDIYELFNVLNDKYNMKSSINRLLRSYAMQTIDTSMYDSLYPNPYNIVRINERIKRMCVNSSFSFSTEYVINHKYEMIMKSIITDLKNKFGENYEDIIFPDESGLPVALKYLPFSEINKYFRFSERKEPEVVKTDLFNNFEPISLKYYRG